MSDEMSIYFIDGGLHSVKADYIACQWRYETERVLEFVVAKTRGKARAMFTAKYDLEFCANIPIHKIRGNVFLHLPCFLGIGHAYYEALWETIEERGLISNNPIDRTFHNSLLTSERKCG